MPCRPRRPPSSSALVVGVLPGSCPASGTAAASAIGAPAVGALPLAAVGGSGNVARFTCEDCLSSCAVTSLCLELPTVSHQPSAQGYASAVTQSMDGFRSDHLLLTSSNVGFLSDPGEKEWEPAAPIFPYAQLMLGPGCQSYVGPVA